MGAATWLGEEEEGCHEEATFEEKFTESFTHIRGYEKGERGITCTNTSRKDCC